MPFSTDERKLLLGVKGIGPTVVARIEQMGYATLAALATADVDHMLQAGAALTGSTCWKNSPQARAAMTAAVLAAQGAVASTAE